MLKQTTYRRLEALAAALQGPKVMIFCNTLAGDFIPQDVEDQLQVILEFQKDKDDSRESTRT